MGPLNTTLIATQTFVRPLASGAYAVVLLNREASTAQMSIDFSELGWEPTATASVRDLWGHQALPAASGVFAALVPARAAVMVTLTPA